jgi:hypothetical protein
VFSLLESSVLLADEVSGIGNLTFYDSKWHLIPFLRRIGIKSPSIMYN